VRRLTVERPEPVGAAPPELGRLGPALVWLATAQGAWPPRVPASPRRLVVGDAGSLEDGVAAADELADAGCDLLVLGSAVDPVPGLVALAALLDLEPVTAVGTTGGTDWAGLTVGVRDGLRTARMHVGDPLALLRVTGSAGLAHLTGLLAQSAVRRTPVLLDGAPTTAAAAVLAERLAVHAPAWWLAGQVPPAPAARRGLEDIGLTGLLDLDLALPEGAQLAESALVQAVGLVAEAAGG
jgi:nicotinate-nucleotide--dimethylbenzimidazole phosphoribosyltransferase